MEWLWGECTETEPNKSVGVSECHELVIIAEPKMFCQDRLAGWCEINQDGLIRKSYRDRSVTKLIQRALSLEIFEGVKMMIEA